MKTQKEIESILASRKRLKVAHLKSAEEYKDNKIMARCSLNCATNEQMLIELLEDILEVEK